MFRLKEEQSTRHLSYSHKKCSVKVSVKENEVPTVKKF